MNQNDHLFVVCANECMYVCAENTQKTIPGIIIISRNFSKKKTCVWSSRRGRLLSSWKQKSKTEGTVRVSKIPGTILN